MASKKPVIWMVDAFNNPIQSSGGGVCVEPGNVSELVKAIELLCDSDDGYLSELGENAYSYLLEHHSYDVLGKKWSDLLVEKGSLK